MAIEACRSAVAIAFGLLVVGSVSERARAAQPPVERDPKSEIAERIRQAQSEGGAYSKELIDPLTTLSRLYQEDGRDALANAAIEQALQVMRANYGLRSLEQAPLMRQRIRSEEERGNFAAAWDLERALQTMAAAHPEDLRAAEVFHEIGDKRMDLLERYENGEFPPQLALGCYYAGESYTSSEGARTHFTERHNDSCTSGSRRFARRAMRLDAQRNYAGAIHVLLRQDLYADERLQELERKLIRSSYDGLQYARGRESLGRLFAYEVLKGESLASRTVAYLNVADWDLLFEHRPLALDAYEQTYKFLKQQGTPQADLDELFAPALPIVLPTILPNPLLGDDAPASGYIDVAFEIMNVGVSRRIEIVGSSDDATPAAKDALVRLIQRSRFRPRSTDGVFARASRVVVRYPLHD